MKKKNSTFSLYYVTAAKSFINPHAQGRQKKENREEKAEDEVEISSGVPLYLEALDEVDMLEYIMHALHSIYETRKSFNIFFSSSTFFFFKDQVSGLFFEPRRSSRVLTQKKRLGKGNFYFYTAHSYRVPY